MFIKRKLDRQPAPVEESWTRLKTWYAANAPEVLNALNPGVSEAEIASFEQETGLQLPEDVKESYKIHNGHPEARPGAIVGQPLNPLALLQSWVGFQQQICAKFDASDADCERDVRCTSYPVDAIRCQQYNAHWVAIGDWDGNCYGIDLDPGPNGHAGQVINFGSDEENKFVLAVSWAHFLEDIADELEAGNLSISRDDSGDVQDFGRTGQSDQAMYRFWSEWSESKLPTEFQQVRPASLEPILPGQVIRDSLAQAARESVEEFLREMQDFELKWLDIRPIHELGYGLVVEGPGKGHMLQGLRPGPFRAKEESASKEERYQKLKLGSYARRAIRQYRKILALHCTDRQRANNGRFIQKYPPHYDVARDIVAEVRELSPEQVLVYLQPINGETTRYHLRLSDKWRIDFRDVTRDHVNFRKIPILFG